MEMNMEEKQNSYDLKKFVVVKQDLLFIWAEKADFSNYI